MTIEPMAMPGEHWDAFVAGAGPAGTTVARLLAARGLSVLLVDRATFPRDKVCGCCLNGVAVDALERTGLGGLLGDLGAHRDAGRLVNKTRILSDRRESVRCARHR